MDKFELIYKKINNASNIGIVTHINPDGDAIGSALALWRVLSVYGKQCDCLCDSPLPNLYKDVPFAEYLNKKTIQKYDLMISVDVSNPSRCGCYLPLFEKIEGISFDHHKGRESFAKTNHIEFTSSTAEIIFSFVEKFFKDLISKEVAELLYIGLLTDCGGFAYEYVNANSFLTASKLLSYGINNSDLYRKYLTDRPLSLVKLSGYAISNAIYECGGKLVFLVFNEDILQKFGCGIEQTSEILKDAMRADSILVGISLTEIAKNSYKVSIRSKGDDVSALEIASEFGGGGHKNASGCRLNGDLGIILDKLSFAVSKNL